MAAESRGHALLWNQALIDAGLSAEPKDVDDAVRDAIDLILASPFDPDGVPVYRDRRHERERYIAELPHQFWLKYDVAERVPPTMATVVKVVTFLKRVI